jgi:cytochrome c-type biogenesis protein
MNDLLGALTLALEGAPALALAAAAALGAASVVISPCHLAGIPLVIGVVQANRAPGRSAFVVALHFGLGVLASFALVGGATLALGRLVGDLGPWGNALGAALCILFGLQLLEVVDLPWFRPRTANAHASAGRPAFMGFLFGASLGPCTFSFMAPALGVAMALARSRPAHAAGLLAAFLLAHTGAVVVAGLSGDWVERFMRSRGATRGVALFRSATGVLLILGGLGFVYSMR